MKPVGYQQPTCLCVKMEPEPPKERGELTTLHISAIQILHSTVFTHLLLLRIQR